MAQIPCFVHPTQLVGLLG